MISPLSRQRDARFDLTGLCTAAADMLGSVGPEDQRIRALPDARTVRYYQTIGLVDRPEREGREAVYGWRHLLQVVAVKRLQLRGEPLVRIQAALVGVSTEALEALRPNPMARFRAKSGNPHRRPSPRSSPANWRPVCSWSSTPAAFSIRTLSCRRCRNRLSQ